MNQQEKLKIKKQMEHTLLVESKAIANVASTLDIEASCILIDWLKNCKANVITVGCGTSGVICKKIAHTLSCIQIPSFFLSPSDSLHGAVGVVGKSDIVIFVSKGGMTEELIAMLPAIKNAGAKIITVSENDSSILSRESDLFIQIKTEEEPDKFNMLATASTLSVIAYFDAIIIVLQHIKNYKKEHFLSIHPGGKVGKELLDDLKGN